MAETVHKSADEKFCSECGAVIKARSEICPKCGVHQMPPPGITISVSPNGRSRLVAALLALFLGGFGIHKFYLGRLGWASSICSSAGPFSRRSSASSKGLCCW